MSRIKAGGLASFRSFPSLDDALLRLLILAEPLEYRLTQPASRHEVHEPHRTDEKGIEPESMLISSRQRMKRTSSAGACLSAQHCRRYAQRDMSPIDQRSLIILREDQAACAIVFGNHAGDDKIIVEQVLALDPLFGPTPRMIQARPPFGDDPFQLGLFRQRKQRDAMFLYETRDIDARILHDHLAQDLFSLHQWPPHQLLIFHAQDIKGGKHGRMFSGSQLDPEGVAEHHAFLDLCEVGDAVFEYIQLSVQDAVRFDLRAGVIEFREPLQQALSAFVIQLQLSIAHAGDAADAVQLQLIDKVRIIECRLLSTDQHRRDPPGQCLTLRFLTLVCAAVTERCSASIRSSEEVCAELRFTCVICWPRIFCSMASRSRA